MTDTMTEQEIEIVLWEAEDPFEFPCQRHSGCPNRALYKFIYVPAETAGLADCFCGHVNFCMRCKDVMIAAITPDTIFSCRHCNGYTRLKRIDPILR